MLLVREAGGEFADWDGNQAGVVSRTAVVSNGIVAGEFFESMRDAGLDV
jgi:hypothetical protein